MLGDHSSTMEFTPSEASKSRRSCGAYLWFSSVFVRSRGPSVQRVFQIFLEFRSHDINLHLSCLLHLRDDEGKTRSDPSSWSHVVWSNTRSLFRGLWEGIKVRRLPHWLHNLRFWTHWTRGGGGKRIASHGRRGKIRYFSFFISTCVGSLFLANQISLPCVAAVISFAAQARLTQFDSAGASVLPTMRCIDFTYIFVTIFKLECAKSSVEVRN